MANPQAPFQSAASLVSTLANDAAFLGKVSEAADCVARALLDSSTLLVAGNGGSAAEAQHFSAEVVGRFVRERRGYAAVALHTDTSILTAVGNDYGFDTVFSRQVEALGRAGDVFFGLSTSGNSANIIRAIEAAKARGMKTISLMGRDGGKMRGLADIDIIVPAQETARIQEVHLLAIHAICEMLDERLS